MGVRVGLGRSGATLAQCVDAVAAGASFVTQLFSRMPPFHHRDPGPVGLLVETPPGAARVHYTLDMRTTISAHTANLATSAHPDGATLVTAAERGDDADLSACVRRLWEARGKGDPCAALRAASAAPAALLGLDAKGRLTPGADADLVLLAPDDLSACARASSAASSRGRTRRSRGAENGGRHLIVTPKKTFTPLIHSVHASRSRELRREQTCCAASYPFPAAMGSASTSTARCSFAMVAIDLLVRGTVIHTPSFSSLAVLENAVLGVHDGRVAFCEDAHTEVIDPGGFVTLRIRGTSTFPTLA